MLALPPQHFKSRRDLPSDVAQRLEHCAFTYGDSYDSYLAMEGDREYFFSSGRRGVVAFCRWGSVMQIAGGLLADPADREELLVELLEFARSRRWRITFFGLGRSDFKLFRAHGFQMTKVGEEPLVLLDETEWRGQPYEWLRRQENGCLKQGLTVSELGADVEASHYREVIAPELLEISRDHLAGTLHRREMKFFVGQFDPHDLGRRRLFVAKTGDRIEAFVVLNPCLNGSMWAIEIFRKRRDAARGIIPFAMLQVMRQLKKEKVQYVSLSMVPWVRMHATVSGDSFLMRFFCNTLWKYCNSLYDVRGMYHFKSRFRPHWRELYIACQPKFGWSNLTAIGMTWGLLYVNPFRLLKHCWRDYFDPTRKSLAEPPWRPERLIRDLNRPEQVAEEAAAVRPSAEIAPAQMTPDGAVL
jgi:phosphatidylglycerol lysyltransferase